MQTHSSLRSDLEPLGGVATVVTCPEALEVVPVRPPGFVPGIDPPVLARGKEASVTDIYGNGYIDYTAAGGALILGYLDDSVAVAINKAVSKGCNIGSPSRPELDLAQRICDRMPFIEQVRFVNTGFEAVIEAFALARHTTEGRRVVCFEKDHRLGEDAIVLTHNNVEAVRETFQAHGPNIAAAFVKPVADHCGPVAPDDGFLEALRLSCDQHGSLLIFDEATSGFRIDPGGAASLYGVVPDLTILGSQLGGGLPLAAYGGRQEIMQHIQSLDHETQTLAVSLPALAAGVATLETLSDPVVYEDLEQRSVRLDDGLRRAAAEVGLDITHRRIASMVGMYLTDDDEFSGLYLDSQETGQFGLFYQALLERGIHIPSSPFSCWFVSTAHTDVEIDRTLEAVAEALRVLQETHDTVTAM